MGTAYELCQLGCDFNPALSLHYNALAARQGESEADMAISKWFLCGHEGVFDKNEELAFKYAQRAAAGGLGTAEFAIGYFYEIGMYVQVDYKEAQRWYAKAAAHGNKDASGRIDGISRSKTLSRKDHEAVAISKIKARHGSQRRAQNPLTERRQSTAPPVVGTIDEAVDMPDPTVPGAMGGGPPGIPPAGTYLTGPPRPFTSMSDSNTGRRPSGAGRQGYGPPPGHPPSSNGPDGAGYPGGYTGEAAPRVNTPKPHQHALDIGFEAPDPRPKPSKTAPPSGPIAPPPGGPPRPGTAQGRPGTGQGRPNTAQGPQSPIIKKPLPGTQHGGGQGSSEFFGQTNGPSSPPRAATQAARPVSAEAPPKPASTPLPKPPGKGPKTFEEMGVPQGPKNEQDCVIM
ncbi:hypothetical protein Q9L58_003202 [Maublancomyces gigas]|uniref:Uncharacterized protein n=1 Tax=Discina gigas TaxID=1032678 RepID=A0ABR3GPZ3_9PEZI